NYCA
ncbi:hypothetical protein BVZ65_00215B, partial [Haemophilus influenzae]